jgi:pimeloyl-ACP methyl ester carboxylesterase
LAERDDIDATRIGLHANSESGWFTPEIAVRTGKVAFVFNRVGPPLSWMENVIWEVRNDAQAAGIAEADIASVVEVTRRRWQYYVDAASDPSLAEGPEPDAINAELRRIVAEVPGAESEVPTELPPYDRELYERYQANFGYDPLPFLIQLDIPVVYTFAEQDINVPTEQSVAFLERFREQHDKDIEIVVIQDVGHLMAAPRGFLYGGYVPELIEVMDEFYSDWAIR